jgi:hypothetical protein
MFRSPQGPFSQHGAAREDTPPPTERGPLLEEAEEWEFGVSLVEESDWLRTWRLDTGKALALSKVFKFSGKYWLQWKNSVLSTLRGVGLDILVTKSWKLVTQSSVKSAMQFSAASTIVRNFLIDHMSTDQSSDLAGCSDVREMWVKLLNTYENKGIDQWTHIFESWGAHVQGNSTFEQYVREEEEFRERLKSLGKNFGEDIRVHYLTKGMHPKYKVQAGLYKSLEKPYDWIVAEFRSMELTEGKKPRNPEANYAGQGDARKKQKPKRCTKCGEPGHNPATCSATLVYDADKKLMPLCFNCREHGHMAKACPKRQGSSSSTN